VPLPFHEAFALSALDQDVVPGLKPSDSSPRIDRRHVYWAMIPAFAYEVEPSVPPRTIETIGTRLLMVTRKGVPRRTIERLLDVVFASSFAQAVQPPVEPKLLELPPELPWHDGTIVYLRRNAPMIAGDALDLFEKGVSICGALLGAMFFLGHWIRRRYRYRRDRGFEAYILRVNDVDRRTMDLELAAALDLGALLGLQKELSLLKNEALEKFADGDLDGEELMSGFLTHVSDTRDYLTRLILHDRDSLEKQARREGRDAEELWLEAVNPPER
jgi:hypothetical protein